MTVLRKDGRAPCGVCTPCKRGLWEHCYFPMGGNGERDPMKDKPAGLLDRAIDEEKSYGGTKSFSSKTTTSMYGGGWDSGGGKGTTTTWERCATTHKPLVVPVPGGASVTLYGGAASSPVKLTHDIYVSLSSGSEPPIHNYPWDPGAKPVIFTYPVTDMCAPKDPESFKKMVGWLKEQALAGRAVHVGCLGGHGRTGTLLAALVKELGGIEDAVTYVRKNYCDRAVESTEQVEFLAKHFGITKVKGYKSGWGGHASGKQPAPKTSYASRHNEKFGQAADDIALPVKPCSTRGNVWGVG